MNLFTSNRMEILSRTLCETLTRQPLASPFAQEVVVVQSTGMRRWLSMEMARHAGVCTHVRFVFPNVFLYDMLQQAFPDRPVQSPVDSVDAMTWAIAGILAELPAHPELLPLSAYLKEGGELKRYQLATRIADTFDQYMVFRPDMLLRWESGPLPREREERWQAHLWKILTAGGNAGHRAELWKTFLLLAESGDLPGTGFPSRVSVFGISTLPRFHMQVLAALSGLIDVRLFVLNPCREYWGDILSGFELKREETRADRRDIPPEARHLERGNSLLASMGMVARDFFSMINDVDHQDRTCFEAASASSMLACIQNDILDLKDASDPPRVPVAADDRSIQICSCHSPMREVEVLHDNLLAMFEADDGLFPEDILVMAPDMNAYAPYIQAVFDTRRDEGLFIPCTITDRRSESASPVVKAFMGLLALSDSRFELSVILEILELSVVRERFDISESEFLRISRWISDTGVRWGIDGAFKEARNLPGLVENTWESGIDSLLLGCAMAGKGENPFGSVLPYDPMEGSDTDTLEKFLLFWNTLLRVYRQCGRRRPPDQWQKLLAEAAVSMFVADASTDTDLQMVTNALHSLGESARCTGFSQEVGLPVIRELLEKMFAVQEYGASFISGGVTFCSMLPMRSIPFPVIGLLGMNVDDYPRQTFSPGFDMIRKHPRSGDRSKRNDDRYLFLEILLSARKRLYISYVGHDMRDNSERPPSVLVSELCDYMRERFDAGEGVDGVERISTHHRLQPFHPDYFCEKKSGRFSYAADYRDAALQLANREKNPQDPGWRAVDAPEDAWRTVELNDLCGFFAHPVRFFLTRRLNLRIAETEAAGEDSEPFDVTGLDRYQISRRLVERLLSEQDTAPLHEALRVGGLLPHGEPGKRFFDTLCAEARRFADRVRAVPERESLRRAEIRLAIGGSLLYGALEGVGEQGWFRYRYADGKPKDWLSNWIAHLAWSMTGEGRGTGRFAARDGWWLFPPVDDPGPVLVSLLDIYRQGLSRPLHFFPKSAFAYGEELRKSGDAAKALDRALRAWHGDNYGAGEKEDSYYELWFGGSVPLDAEFEKISEAVIIPLLEGRQTDEAPRSV